MYCMIDSGMYGEVIVTRQIFQQLDQAYFISGSDDHTKYMCANSRETAHLASLGIKALNTCDWYKIVLDSGVESA